MILSYRKEIGLRLLLSYVRRSLEETSLTRENGVWKGAPESGCSAQNSEGGSVWVRVHECVWERERENVLGRPSATRSWREIGTHGLGRNKAIGRMPAGHRAIQVRVIPSK